MQYSKEQIERLDGCDNYELIEMSTLTNDNLHVLRKFLMSIIEEQAVENTSILFEESDGYSKPTSKAERTLNIMLLGEPRVGKTSFFEKFFNNENAYENYLVTVGNNYNYNLKI